MSFVVELNSLDGTGDIFNRTYMLDWSFFEDGEYELSYAFKSGLQSEVDYGITTSPFSLALPDLVLKNVVSVKNSRTQSSNIIGQLSMEVFGTGIWYRSHPSNLPVRCCNPTSYEFRVQLLDITGDLLTAFEDYNLILYFNKK